MSNACIKHFFAVAALYLTMTLTFPAVAGNPHGKSFKDWRVHCNSSSGAPSVCIMVQDVVFKSSRKRVLQFVIRYIEDGKTLIADIILPLGIYLPAGVTMQIDKGQVFEIPIEICTDGRMRGCRARFSFDKALLASVKGGAKANIGFQDSRQTPVAVPVSLAGVTAGLKAIK
jgi:invasion protein IalB